MSAALFDLDPEGNAEQAQRIGNNLSIAPPEPTVFTGFGGAVGNHIMRAAANTGRTAAVLATAPAIAIEKATAGDNYSGNATPLSGPIFKSIDEVFNPAVDYWTPKASETGVAGRIVGGLVEGLAPLTLGPAGVPAMIGNAQVGTAVDLMNQGVDAGTAQQVGTAAGVANAVGFKMPFLGNSLVTRMGSGAAGNLVVNAGAAAVQGKTLEGNGYEKAAKQFDPLNPEARAIDLVLGAAFGILAHKGAPILPSQGDAALALRNAKNFQQDSAPGTPMNAASSSAHQNAMEQAMLTLARGEKVNVADSIVDADFMKPPPMKETAVTTAVREAIVEMHPMTPVYPGEVASIVGKVRTEADMAKAAALTEPEIIRGNIQQRSDANLAELKAEIKRTKDPAALAILNEELVKVNDARAKSGTVATPQELAKLIPKADNLSPAHSAVEGALRTKIANDYQAARVEYAAIPKTEGGRIMDTDIARELSPEYRADRSLSAAVHEPASWFVKEYYADRLAELPKGSDVLFTAGGGGAGKSSAFNAIPDMRTANERAGLVYDTTMSRLQSSVDLVQRALDAGHNVKVVMVDRDPVDAFVNGVLPRAMDQGRTVPLNQVLAAHRDVPGVIRELQKRYADNPKFNLSVVDNTLGQGKAALTSLDKLPQRDYNQIERAMHDALEQQYQSDSISESVYRATLPPGSLQSLPPQRIPRGLPQSDGSPTGYLGGGIRSDGYPTLESPNGRGNAQADSGAAAGVSGNNQGGEGGTVQDSGIRLPEAGKSSEPLAGLNELSRVLSDSGIQIPEGVTQALGKFTELMGTSPKPATEKQSAVPATPEFTAMQKIAKDSPDSLVLDGYDADGNPSYTSMRDAAAQIEADHAEAIKETKSYDAAVNCLLRRGG